MLQSMGSRKVRHNLATQLQQITGYSDTIHFTYFGSSNLFKPHYFHKPEFINNPLIGVLLTIPRMVLEEETGWMSSRG